MDYLVKRKQREYLLNIIANNANTIRQNESKPFREAEYLSICCLLDGLRTRSDGLGYFSVVIDILAKEHSQYQADAWMFLSVITGEQALTELAQAEFIQHHS